MFYAIKGMFYAIKEVKHLMCGASIEEPGGILEAKSFLKIEIVDN
jgi:hypothetical protein